jgi:lipopolysaccharide assembly protein B
VPPPQRLTREGRHAEAVATWNELRQRHPGAFVLVAVEHAASAQAAGLADEALAALQSLYAQQPSTDLLQAIDRLEGDASRAHQRHAEHLARQPSLSAAAAVLRDMPASDLQGSVIAAVDRAALPLQRYRCAACGFEAQRYFWQCPGCLSWDSYPPQRLEDQ